MSDFQQPNSFEQIQSLCRDFRQQLRGGAQKRIEDYLDRVYEDSREMLFQNLLHIDIEFQRRQGSEPSSDEYITRFPDRARLIRQAFFESTLMSADPAAETPATQRTQLQDAPAGRRLGEYELQRQIGRGAFGAVYKAKHLQRGDIVALKLLPLAVNGNANASGDADRLHKFRREFRALCDVNHPNLVGMQTLEVDGNQWFFTMDLVEGTDFLDYVRPGGTADIDRLRSATRQLAEGIAALHRLHIVHRDLKPANVMVDHDGDVNILDFGLVIEGPPRAEFTVLMSTGGFAGTPLYAAPEQMFGDCDQASDWYAVGVMLYEALTGKPPFRGSAAELMRTKSATSAPQLQGRPGVPDDLGQLADKLLQRDPDLRPDGETILDRLGVATDTGSHDSTDNSVESAGSGTHQALIGRETELETLRSLHSRMQKSRDPLTVFVKGRSGEGKTSLVEAFLRSLHTDGRALVLSGRCYDRESVPFKAIDAVIDSLVLFLRSRPEEEVRAWMPDDIVLLAHLFPVLRRVSPIGERSVSWTDAQDTQHVRHRAFAALRDLLTEISADTPVILFLDDLQWGDGDSATALRDVLQPPGAPAVMLLGTCRIEEAADSAFLKEWADSSSATDEVLPQHELEVGPLSEDECLSFLASRLNKDPNALSHQAQQLFEGTRGNPYFLEQLLEDFNPQTGDIEAMPLADLIERRLNRLPSSALPLLQAIAVAGQAVTLPEAAVVADRTTAVMSTVSHMRNERLVRLVGDGASQLVDTYHDKIRETVLQSMAAVDRRHLHLKFGEFLESALSEEGTKSLDEPVNSRVSAGYTAFFSTQQNTTSDNTSSRLYDLAYHFDKAGDPRAFRYQLAAGQAALNDYAMETALEFLRRADDLQPADPDGAEQFQLQFALAEALRGNDHLEDSHRVYKSAISVAKSNLDRARCEHGIAHICAKQGNYVKAKRTFDTALALLGEPQPQSAPGQLTGTVINLTAFHCAPSWLIRFRRRDRGDDEAALIINIRGLYAYLGATDMLAILHVFSEITAEARYAVDAAVKATAYTAYGGFLAMQGLSWPGRRYIRKGEALLAECTSAFNENHAKQNLGVFQFLCGNLDEANRHLLASIPQLERAQSYLLAMSFHWLRHVHSVRGDVDAIMHWARQEKSYGERTNDTVSIAYGLYGLADGLSRRGDYQQAIEHAQQSVRILSGSRLWTAGIAQLELGRAQLQASDFHAAVETLRRNTRSIFRNAMFCELFLDNLSLHCEAVLGADWIGGPNAVDKRRRRESRWIGRCARFFCWTFPTLRPHCHRVRGRVAFAHGNTRQAIRCFDKAIACARKIDARYEHARALIDKSLLDHGQAAADRETGLRMLKELGCVLPPAERCYLNLAE